MAREAGELSGRWLRRAREEQGLSQEELAARSGLSVRTVASLEQGRTRRPHPRSVRLLASALALPEAAADELVTWYRTRCDSTSDVCQSLAGSTTAIVVSEVGSQEPGTAISVVPVVPRQLPAVVTHFVGRPAELDFLEELVGEAMVSAARPGRGLVVAAISGTAGSGKTALAVHWAYQVADRFPDGQLYANLRGFDPAGTPAAPGEVIRAFLGSLRVPAEQIPPEPEAQAGLYRSLLAGRRMLIVLDNARDAAQVRPLLPGASGCLVLVTSRSQLAGLAATHGARLVNLGMLTGDEAAELLARHLGQQRVAAEPDGAGQLASLCGGLPLALAVTAARAAARPGFGLAVLAAGLRDEHGGLDALDAGDEAVSLRAVFSWSYQSLPAPAAALFRILGIHPGPDISEPAAASLADLDLAQARKLMTLLAGACLITEHAPGRYALHDLHRAYAAEQACTLDLPAVRQAAIGRVLDHYLHTAAAADRLLNPQRDPVSPDLPQPGSTPAGFADYRQAISWFEAEHDVLLAAVALAGREGFDTHAWQLSWALADYLDRQAHWPQWKAAQHIAGAAADRTGDKAAQAHTRRGLGHVWARLGRYRDAHDLFAQALGLYAELSDDLGQARAHHDTGWCYGQQGSHQQALHHCQQALRLARAASHRATEGQALNAIGWHSANLGDHQLALASCQQALEVAVEQGDRFEEAHVQDSLGYAHHRAQNHRAAVACYQQALSIYRDLNDPYNQAKTLARVADAHHAAGQPQAARECRQQALAIFDDLRHLNAIQIAPPPASAALSSISLSTRSVC